MTQKLKYVDLFAGCGGLSLGLEQAGFELALAVEKSDMAAETFFHNFVERISDEESWQKFASPETSVLEQAEKKLVVKELAAVLACPELLARLKRQNIDLVAGGPPCQGFSLAGRRNPEDVRNKLPWQYLEFVAAVQPKAVIIENVSGMSQDFLKHGKESPFDQLRLALMEAGPGYAVQPTLLNAKHFGTPQHRPRVMLLALRKDVADVLGYTFCPETWKSDFDKIESKLFPERPQIVPSATHFDRDVLTVKSAISDLSRGGYRGGTVNLSEFAKEMREDESWMPKQVRLASKRGPLANHTLRKHAPRIETRFRLYQYLQQQKLSPKILGISKTPNVTDGGLRTLVEDAIKTARVPAKAPDGTVIAVNRDDLVELIMSLGTKKHSQRPLDWDAPSPTVVSLPDDYVHPGEPRTLTVRELARFQSFPDSFEFRSKETTGSLRRRYEVPQYTQVGNAVPPKMARAVGNSISRALIAARTAINKSDAAA